VFDKIQTVQPGAIVDNKRLSAVLEQVKAQQAAYSSASAARAHRTAAAAEQPRGARSAVEGARTTPSCCRGCGLRQRFERCWSPRQPCIPFNGDATGQAG